jgi:small subunit ribosomal protein S13
MDKPKIMIRIANTDLEGKKQIYIALRKIKGVGFMFSNAICNSLGMDKRKLAGTLDENEVKAIEALIESPKKFPNWLLNRRKDYDTGEDKNLSGADLDLKKDFDIKRLKKIKSYRGGRHDANLPVRGQRTKSNFRKNKGKVSLGVAKKAAAKPDKV